MKLSKIIWCMVGLLALDCLMRIAALAYWAWAPEAVPGIPMLSKGVRYPEVQAILLLLTVPVLTAIAWPPLRSPHRFLWLGGGLMLLGLAAFVLGLFLSFNVVGSGVIYCGLGQALIQSSRSRGLQSS
ncbi:hypothetical protein ACS5PN_21180 [Roseateles sp. NT4]|uniref:hypothetical protein n=1 Tax=Roseateles sp. NT4 TaxID=3453715 RepID=UPI003EEA7D34